MAYGFEYTRRFLKQYKKLSSAIQAKTDEAILKMAENPHDPSLMAKKVQGAPKGHYREIFEARVTYQYRMTWEYASGNTLSLRNVDNHDECLKNP